MTKFVTANTKIGILMFSNKIVAKLKNRKDPVLYKTRDDRVIIKVYRENNLPDFIEI